MVQEKTRITIPKEKLDRYIDSVVSEEEGKRKFKLPSRFKSGFVKKIKKNNVLTFFVRTNGSVSINWRPIEDDMIYIPETNTYHSVKANNILNYEGKPSIILPEWSLEPFTPKEHLEETVKKGESALPQKVILQLIKSAQLKAKSTIQGNKIIWIVVLVVGALYLLSKIMGK